MAAEFYGRKALRPEDDILVCAGDVETDGLGGKLLMIQWGFLGQIKHASGETMIADFFEDFLQLPRPAIWYFHFGQYDWRYFLEYIEQNKLLVEIGMRTENDVYEIRVKRNEKDAWCVMRDSWALWSHPLEKLAQAFCPEIPKLKIDIEHFDPKNPEHIEYARRDVQILLLGLPRLFDALSQHFGVNAGATAAGTALKAWQKTLPKDKIYDCQQYNETELFIREGYYGGLVFLTNNRINSDCITFDRNSSYPAAMLEYGVPVGRPQYTQEYDEQFTGIYRCKVRAPDNLIIPILPARNERGAMRWYRGEFETTVTARELQFAAQNGYEILDIYEGYCWEETEFPFTDFINLCRFLRKEFKGKTEEQLAKLMQNSLYGKFGTRRERTRMLSAHFADEEDLIGAAPFDDAGLWYVKKELDTEMRCMPHWAVFITANARLSLLEQAYNAGPENVIYGDTDSLTLKRGVENTIDVGDEYGQWKLEKEWQVFRAIAPKVYSGILADGTFKGAAKGLPRKGITDRHWSELLENGATSAETLSLASLKVAFKKGVQPARQLLRKSSTLTNSQNFALENAGDVRVKYRHG